MFGGDGCDWCGSGIGCVVWVMSVAVMVVMVMVLRRLRVVGIGGEGC